MPSKLNKEQQNKLKKQAVGASIALSVGLSLLKLFAAFTTGSLAIISSMIDSLADVFASSISFIAVKFSTKPATCEHRYGYGRAESISALIQSAFVAGSGLFVMYDGVVRLFKPIPLERTSVGIVIMVVSLLATIALIIFQRYVVKHTDSVAVNADSAHYLVDVLTNVSIILSLLVVRFFKLEWFDILTAFIISAYLMYNAYNIAADAVGNLTDKELNPQIRAKVINIITESEGIIGFHDFRTRDLGGIYHFEIHLELDGNMSLYEAHKLTDMVEDNIRNYFPDSQITIHQDPHGIRENRLDYHLEGNCEL